MRATRLAVVTTALLSLGTVAHADPLKVEIGVFGGYHLFSNTNQLGRDVGSTTENRLKNSGTFGMRLGFIVHPLVELEAELGLIPTSAKTSAGRATALDLGYRAHILVHVLKGKVRPFILAGGGGATLSSSNSTIVHEDTDGEFHFGVGLKGDIRPNWGMRVDARLYIEPSTTVGHIYATNDYEVTLGLYGLFGGPKKVAAVEPKLVISPDIDGDGILNADDLCPEKKGPAVNQGCPDVDTDGDLVVDRLDRCPKDKGIEENNGCPDVDTDKDSVVDRLDKCPEVAGPPENGGCPDTDSDKDGVSDRLDKCPNEPETVNGYKDLDGCPDELPVAIKKYTSGALKGIYFETGKTTLLPTSTAALGEIVSVLKDYPDVKIEVGGHTDTVGERNANIDLSKGRAEAVRQYFVTHGIQDSRVTSMGYGPDKPVADNKTKAGKAKNRRVEMKLIN